MMKMGDQSQWTRPNTKEGVRKKKKIRKVLKKCWTGTSDEGQQRFKRWPDNGHKAFIQYIQWISKAISRVADVLLFGRGPSAKGCCNATRRGKDEWGATCCNEVRHEQECSLGIVNNLLLLKTYHWKIEFTTHILVCGATTCCNNRFEIWNWGITYWNLHNTAI